MPTATDLDPRPAAPAAGPTRSPGSVLSAAARVGFLLLLAAAVTGDQLGWSWWWVPAAAVAGGLNLRAARRIPGRRPGDLVFAASLVPTELFRWLLVRPAGRLRAA